MDLPPARLRRPRDGAVHSERSGERDIRCLAQANVIAELLDNQPAARYQEERVQLVARENTGRW